MGNRKRKNYLKESEEKLTSPIFFSDKLISPITIVETRPINIEGVKDGLYYANNIGQVFNNRGQEIKQNLINSGYYCYKLYTGERIPETNRPLYKGILAHRLFADVFDLLSLDDKSMTIDHINMDKSRNELSNLEVVSQLENNERKSKALQYHGAKVCNSTFSFQDLIVIVNELEKGTKYADILVMINKPVTKLNKDYIGNIKRGITYKKEVALIKEKRLNDYSN